MIKRKLLTIEDLVRFCQENKFSKFSSTDSGYQLAVQIPTSFEIDQSETDNHRGMLRLKFRIFHDGLNRNGSFVSRKAADQAAPTIADRPILAAIHQLDDGSWDFHAHDIEISEDEDGNNVIEYIEKQVGSFSSEPTFWEYDENTDKNYLCAYGYIPEEYTRAADIIRSKDGWTKNSCELSIEEMTYNAKKKYLDLTQFYVSASTLLGSEDDGTEIGEGMLGSRADIEDFSSNNNSLLSGIDNELKEYIQASITEALENINSKGKEEQTMDEENVKVTETSEEEVETTEEVVTEEETTTEEVTTTEESSEEVTVTEAESEEVSDVTPSKDEEKFTKTFEISHEDIRYALYNLLSPFEDEDNDWYGISAVYDDYFIYEGWFNAEHKFKQGYKRDGDNVSFDGDRVHMNVEYLTDNELTQLNEMRSNYSKFEEMSKELDRYHAEPDKQALLDSEDYSQIRDTKQYTELVNNHFEIDTEDLAKKLDEILLDYAKKNKIESATFSADEMPKVGMKKIPIQAKKKSGNGRYGNMFVK